MRGVMIPPLRGWGYLPALGSGALRNYNPLVALGTNLIAWWDANSAYWGAKGGMTDDGGGLISSWRDVVAAYDATAAAAARPTFSATSFNGAPGLTADGTANCFVTTDATLMAQMSGGATCEFWALVQQDSLVADATTRNIINCGAGAAAVSRAMQRIVTGGVNRARFTTGDGAGSTSVTDTTVSFSSRHVIRAVVGASTTTLVIDGSTPFAASVVPNTTATRLRIFSGSGGAAAGFFQGQGAAFLITELLSTAQAANLQAWLLSRRRI